MEKFNKQRLHIERTIRNLQHPNELKDIVNALIENMANEIVKHLKIQVDVSMYNNNDLNVRLSTYVDMIDNDPNSVYNEIMKIICKDYFPRQHKLNKLLNK